MRTSGKIYEALVALLQRRPRSNLYHSALVATSADGPVLVEMAPEFDDRGHADRGVVATGAVGAAWLRRFRVFRYEVRRWRNGVIPDLAYAIGGPIRISDDRETVRAVLELLPEVPTPVWGRDELGTGDMWNSNSVVSWALASFGLEARAGSPPGGGRAPGWTAGVVVARRKAGSAADSVVNRVGGHRTAR